MCASRQQDAGSVYVGPERNPTVWTRVTSVTSVKGLWRRVREFTIKSFWTSGLRLWVQYIRPQTFQLGVGKGRFVECKRLLSHQQSGIEHGWCQGRRLLRPQVQLAMHRYAMAAIMRLQCYSELGALPPTRTLGFLRGRFPPSRCGGGVCRATLMPRISPPFATGSRRGERVPTPA